MMEQEVNPLAEEVASSRQTASLDQLDAPIPGQSLTDEPGKWAWERPARFSSVEESFEHVVNQIEGSKQGKESFTKLMLSGIPIEQIVNTITFGGFTEGYWTADVSELLKLPVLSYLIDMAMQEDLPVKVFSDASVKRYTDEGGMDAQTLLQLMRENNPKAFDNVIEGIEGLESDLRQEQMEFSSALALEEDDDEEVPFMEMEE